MIPGFDKRVAIIRLSKILFVIAAAALAGLTGVNNVLDYGAHFTFVQHVLMMDTVFPDNPLIWRAVETPWIHHLVYWLIILIELVIGALGIWGAVDLWQVRHDATLFNQRKTKAICALLLAIMLWFVGFLIIGGEWFLMWQSEDWNAQQAAFRHVVPFLTGLIFVSSRDQDD